MRVARTGPLAFAVAFESEEELWNEYRANLSASGLPLTTDEPFPRGTVLLVELRGPSGSGMAVKATVVAPLVGGVALGIEGKPDEIFQNLLAAPAQEADEVEELEAASAAEGSLWERLRGISRMEKLHLAARADRSERAILLQDSDPQVLFSLLRNPRLTIDEVIRLAKSPYMTYQTAELMMKSPTWYANQDVRIALIHNAKMPLPFALRILPTLPESELRNISRGAATSMALKQAALRKLQGTG